MSSNYKFRDPDQLYFVTFSVVYWIDLFIRKEYRDILLKSWEFCKSQKGMELYAWCIMTSHVHMIIGSNQEKPEDIMRDMKKYTSFELKKAIGEYYGESRKEWMLSMMEEAGRDNTHSRNFQLWQEGNHPVELTSAAIMHQKLDYVHNNPVEAGIVEKPEDYLYSSARNYYGGKGLIDVIILDPILV